VDGGATLQLPLRNVRAGGDSTGTSTGPQKTFKKAISAEGFSHGYSPLEGIEIMVFAFTHPRPNQGGGKDVARKSPKTEFPSQLADSAQHAGFALSHRLFGC